MTERHSLCRPASPGSIIQQALADSGRDADWLRGQLGCSRRVMREILDDTEPLSLLEALAIGGVFERPDLKLIAAQCACGAWDEREAELAKERRRDQA